MKNKEFEGIKNHYPPLSTKRLNFEYQFLVHFVHKKTLRLTDTNGNKRQTSEESEFSASVWAFEQACCVLKGIDNEKALTQATTFISNLFPEVTYAWQKKMNNEIYLESKEKRVVKAFEQTSNKADQKTNY